MSIAWPLASLGFLVATIAACAGSLPSASAPATLASQAASAGPTKPTPTDGSPMLSAEGRLEIVAPRSGDTITLPALVEYRITGLDATDGLVLRLVVESLEPIEIPLPAAEGTVTIADDKMTFLPGHRDVSFQLVDASGVLLAPPVLVEGLTIEGRRGG